MSSAECPNPLPKSSTSTAGRAKLASSSATARKSSSTQSSSKGKARDSKAKARPKRTASGERKRSGRKSSTSKKSAAETPRSKKGAEKKEESKTPRKLGVRGAAPWVARHAAKQAEELRKRNAEPAPPGSARATLREPEDIDNIKRSIARLHEVVSQIKKLSRNLDKNFFAIGELLRDLKAEGVHTAKGFSSFEALMDRELSIPHKTALRLMRIVDVFQRESAEDYPLDHLFAALQALDGELPNERSSARSGSGLSARSLPLRPPRSWNG